MTTTYAIQLQSKAVPHASKPQGICLEGDCKNYQYNGDYCYPHSLSNKPFTIGGSDE